MIKIKDYIFNENEIEYIKKELEGIIVCPKAVNVELKAIENATFEDIEWDYENNNEYCNVFYEDRIEELEEKNKTFEDYNKDLNNQLDKLQQKIDKVIEYIEDIEEDKEVDNLFIKKKEKSFLVFYKIKNDLLKILKGE